MCQKRDDLDQRIIECRSQLYQNCPAVLVQSIRDKIQQLNSKLFQYLYQLKTQKFTNLVGPSSYLEPPKDNQLAVTLPNNFPLSEPEKSVLSKGLNFVPIAKRTDEFSVKQDLEKFLRRVQLKAFFHDKSDSNGFSDKDVFQELSNRKSKWTPPDGQFATIDFFLQKCWHDVSKFKFNRNSRSSNLKPDEWSALLNLRKHKDITIKTTDKCGAVVVWRTDLYQQEAFRQLSDNSFYCKVEKDLTPSNQKIVKETVHDLIFKQELPATAQNLIINTPRTSVINFKPKIHKPDNPGRPIVSAYSCPTELISQYLHQIVTFC